MAKELANSTSANPLPRELPAYTKKDQILGFYLAGAHSVAELSALTGARPTYVAEVLRQANALGGYFDLYTTTEQPMNIYSRLFSKRLGFRTEKIAQRSVEYIERVYNTFAQTGDRAGQHHAMVMALTMYNRARWNNKPRQAALFGHWLSRTIATEDPVARKSTNHR